MKGENRSKQWQLLALVALIGVALHSGLSDPGASECPGSGYASVYAEGGGKRVGATDSCARPKVNTGPLKVCRTESVFVTGWGVAGEGTVNSDTGEYICGPMQIGIPADLQIAGNVDTKEVWTEMFDPADQTWKPFLWGYILTNPDPEKDTEAILTMTVQKAGIAKGTPGNWECDEEGPFTASLTVKFIKDSSSCAGSCGSNLGDLEAEVDSLAVRMHLGSLGPGAVSSHLQLRIDTPNGNMANRALWQLADQLPEITVIAGQDGMDQVRVPQGLIHFSKINDFAYKMECYSDEDAGQLQSSGRFEPTGSPYSTVTVFNPGGDLTPNSLLISETRDSGTRVWSYSYSPEGGRWDLQKPGGEVESVWSQQIESDASGNTTNYLRQLADSTGVVSLKQNIFEYVPSENRRLLKQQVVGVGGDAQTTTYTYYTTGNSIYRVQRIDYPQGEWVYYKYDELGRTITEFRAWGNGTPPEDPHQEPNPFENRCTRIDYEYDEEFVDEYGRAGVVTPWITTKSAPINGPDGWRMERVERTYRVTRGDQNAWIESVQECIDPNDGYKTGSFLLTERSFAHNPLTGDTRIGSVRHSDGTVTEFTYLEHKPGEVMTIENTANHTKVVTVVDSWGKILARTNVSVPNNIVLSSETYNYKDSEGSYLDPLRRSYTVTDLAGRVTFYNHGCCGPSSVINPDGVTTRFYYDSQGRQTAQSISYGAGEITTTNILDSANRTLQTRRIGTDGTNVVLNSCAYDSLGRIVCETNALGGVTITAYAVVNKQLYVTNRFPEGGLRISVYNRDGSLQRMEGSAVNGECYDYGVEMDGGICRSFTTITKLDEDGQPTAEWTKVTKDGVGREYRTVYADSPQSESLKFYNTLGQLWKIQDPDGVVTLYEYDDFGKRRASAVDMDKSDQIERGGIDRITERIEEAVNENGMDVVRELVYEWTIEGDSSPTLVRSNSASTDGLRSWQSIFADALTPVTSSTQVFPGITRTEVRTAPDGSYSIDVFSHGRIVSSSRYDSAGATVYGTTYGYDAHGRRNTTTDGRNGTTKFDFNEADLLFRVTTPAPGTGEPGQQTLTYYNREMRVTNVVAFDGSSVFKDYYSNGLVKKIHGARVFPVEYEYDYAGRIKFMRSWTNFANKQGEAVTTWHYKPDRGWLVKKVYDGEEDATDDYSYTAAGRLRKRVWERGVTTWYDYNDAGELESVDYDATSELPDILYTYNRRGWQTTITKGSITTALKYNDAGNLVAEIYSSDAFDSFTISNRYDGFLRRTTNGVWSGVEWVAQTHFTYNNASRLGTVSDGRSEVVYSYLDNSTLPEQITFKENGAVQMRTTAEYDYLNRLTEITSEPSSSGQTAISSVYTYNPANQRIRSLQSDGSYWLYEYDPIGQIRVGKKYWSDGTPAAGLQFEYTHDDIGNRQGTKKGGDQNGANLRSVGYTVNLKNQYTSRTINQYEDVYGMTYATYGVTVNDQSTYRKGEYFRKELSVDVSSGAAWHAVTIATNQVTARTGSLFIPFELETFTYAADTDDGNLMADGRWTYEWDEENRLRTVRSLIGSPAPERRIVFDYDFRGRRIRKTVWDDRDDAEGAELSQILYVYDGWNLIAELTSDGSPIRRYLWGIDLSGSLQGAGGIGGLLQVSYKGSESTNCFVAYDGNGNVMALVDSATGETLARYEYGPFGEVIRATGRMAQANPIRFSSKYQDTETGLMYYGYRYYAPSTGRWLSRDPIDEKGGVNLYGFVGGNPVSRVDRLGLDYILQCGIAKPSDFGRMECCPDLCNPQAPPLVTSCDTKILAFNISPSKVEIAEGLLGALHYAHIAEGIVPESVPMTCVKSFYAANMPTPEMIFGSALNSFSGDGSYVQIYTKLNFYRCQKAWCFPFARRYAWKAESTEWKPYYATPDNFYDPAMGYPGYEDAAKRASEACEAHIKELE